MKPSHTDKELEEAVEYYSKRYGPYIKDRGLKNWKNLFRKPNIYEWIILLMLIFSLFLAWSYREDIKNCYEYVNQNCPNLSFGTLPTLEDIHIGGLIEKENDTLEE